MSIKQVKFGSSEISFKKLSDQGLNCGPCEVTPTPTPTVQCVTINLKTTVGCDEYTLVNSESPTSSDKLTDALVVEDSLIMSGFSCCNHIDETMPISRCVLSKVGISNSEEGRFFNPDGSFGTNGKVNNLFYDSDNLRVFSKYNKVFLQPGSTQKKIIAVGQANYKPLISRYLQNGYLDRAFGNGLGYFIIDNEIDDIKLLNIFGVYIQKDNKLLILCDGYDLVQKRSVVAMIRLSNNGIIDTSFPLIKIRPGKPEFDGNKLIGKNVYYNNDLLYISFESFSSVTNNNNITCCYNLSDNILVDDFGEDGFIYNNNDNANTYFSSIFVKNITVNNQEISVLFNVSNIDSGSIVIDKYKADTGKAFEILDSDTEETISKYSRLVVDNDIFQLRESINQEAENLTVSFVNMPINVIDHNDDTVAVVNVKIISNPIDILGDQNNTLIHWLEYEGLTKADFSFDGLLYRDCVTESCDRLPEDNYGSLVINKKNIKKYLTQNRILFGYLKFTNDYTSVESIKLDRFSSTAEHNIVKKILNISDELFVCGYSGNNSNCSFSMKSLDLSTQDLDSIGPRDNDISGSLGFDDFCPTISTLDDSVVVEECPCAPAPTPTPSSENTGFSSPITTTNISSECIESIPRLLISWKRNLASLTGNYLVRISSGDTEIIAQNFDIDTDSEVGDININLISLVNNAEINNKTAKLEFTDSDSGETIYSKLFVLNIPLDCGQQTS